VAARVQGRRRMAPDRRQALGILGEQLACEALLARGYEIVERRYRTRFGEIDIVARSDGVTVFVEVKTRDGDRFGDGADAVTPWKQRRVTRMAIDYLARHQLHDTPCRFDVVAVDVSGSPPYVEVYVNAFDAWC
jgi:putative endonuclease